MATDGTGAVAARELGVGWKVSPSVLIEPGEIFVLADIAGAGALQSMWFTGQVSRDLILRVYWDDQEQPSIECPLPDFFGCGWTSNVIEGVYGAPRYPPHHTGPLTRLDSLPVAVNPNRGLNCFWEMPFRHRCLITAENRHPDRQSKCYFQINYTLTDVPDDAGYFHAQFRRVNPLPFGDVYTLVDGINGRGHYVGTAMAWGLHDDGWFGEGEIKFYIDGDVDYPTVCGTGLEDYFGGAYGWTVEGRYVPYSTPFLGMHRVILPDNHRSTQQRFSMYRWHIMDPVRFESDLRVTMQALGWRSGKRYYPRQDDIASVAYWYQALPTSPFPELPDRDHLEII
jgi:hypothetical protein